MNQRKKKIVSVIWTMAIVFMMLGSLGGFSSANTALSGQVTGVVPIIATAGHVNLASIRFSESGSTSFQTGNTLEVTLPDKFAVQTGLSTNHYYEATTNLSVRLNFSNNNRTITYWISRSSYLTDAALLIKLPVIVSGSVPSTGNVSTSVASNTPAISGGSFTVGQYGQLSMNFSVSPANVPTVSQYGPNPQTVARTLRLSENGPGAFKDGVNNRIVLSLPRGAFWANSTYPVQVFPALPSGVTVSATRNSSDYSELNVVLQGGLTEAATAFSIVHPAINVSYLVEKGDLKVDVSGRGTNVRLHASEVLARVEGYSVAVRRTVNVEPFEVFAGRQGQAMANIEIVEGTPGSLPTGGDIKLSLPQGVKFGAAPFASYHGVSGSQPQITDNGQSITMTINNQSTAAGSIVLNFNSTGNILVSPNASGDVYVNVSGTAGAEGTVTIAKVTKLVDVKTTTATNIPNNATNVVAGDILISETGAGRVIPGIIVLDLPSGITFSHTPVVAREEGNIAIGLGTISNEGRRLTIPVNSRSTQASTISVKDIKYDISRSWWSLENKEVKVSVTGISLVDIAVNNMFTDSGDKLSVVNASTARASVEKASVFTIGELTYTQGGQTKLMDQAPVIVSGRTLLPLRFVGEAVGLGDDEILWDPVRRTVTLFRGDRVAQVTIGSKILLLNGAPVEMDVAPEIMNGRTMLPIRFVGLALRAEVEWDAGKRTVTVTPY